MKPLELVVVQLALLYRMSFNVLRKPILELLVGVKELRHYEVEKSPKLGHAVLYRCSSEKKLVS